MLLRWLVNNYLRDAAQDRVRDVLSNVLERPAAGRSEAEQTLVESPERTMSAADEAQEAGEDFLPCDAVFMMGQGIEAGGLIDLVNGAERSRHKHGIEHAGELDKRQIVVVECGVGPAAAARATRAVIDFYQPRWIVSAGFASALTDDLRRGNILLADRVMTPGQEPLEVGLKVDPASLSRGVHTGALLTVDEVVRKSSQRLALAEQHRAMACDMETYGVAQACQEKGTRLLSVRIITEPLHDELPPEIEHLLAQRTVAAKVGAAAGALLRRFSAAKDMWQLREDGLKASDRLAKFLRSMLPQL